MDLGRGRPRGAEAWLDRGARVKFTACRYFSKRAVVLERCRAIEAQRDEVIVSNLNLVNRLSGSVRENVINFENVRAFEICLKQIISAMEEKEDVAKSSDSNIQTFLRIRPSKNSSGYFKIDDLNQEALHFYLPENYKPSSDYVNNTKTHFRYV
jgi:hypothetical protein